MVRQPAHQAGASEPGRGVFGSRPGPSASAGQQPPGAQRPDVLATAVVDPLMAVGVVAAGAMGAVAVLVDVVAGLAVGPLEPDRGPDLRVLRPEAGHLVDLIPDADEQARCVRDGRL